VGVVEDIAEDIDRAPRFEYLDEIMEDTLGLSMRVEAAWAGEEEPAEGAPLPAAGGAASAAPSVPAQPAES